MEMMADARLGVIVVLILLLVGVSLLVITGTPLWLLLPAVAGLFFFERTTRGWSFEARMGTIWVITILALMFLTIGLEIAFANILPLLIPTVAYAAFFAWTVRLQE
ncbi:MAG: hypothetical protein ACE5GX_20100 [Thermoanaerobaculia bacterium]